MGINMDRNGYFQLVIKPGGTYMKLYPAVGEGAPIRFEEIMNYLMRQRISGYPIPELNKAVKDGQEVEIRLLMESILPVQEEMYVTMGQDKMTATARFYPPSSNAKQMEKAEILRSIEFQGVKYGLIEQSVDAFVKEREYCKDYIIAEGTMVKEGSDAKITYHFSLDLNARPKLNEDGSVDFHKLENINGVKEGMLLATLEPEVMGVAGRDVCGAEVKPRPVVSKRLMAGKNTFLKNNDTQLISGVNGHVFLDVDGKVVVSNLYEIKGDVDTSTGDIDYDGDVMIHGNVRTGFSIYATGDVEIDGVVEAANITAGGKIIIRRGIQGMTKGNLKARGNILCRFIESAVVMSGASIEADAIMHSNVSAREEIHVAGKKGLIVGGYVRAGRLIESMTIGSSMGSATSLEVGSDPQLQERIKVLEEKSKKYAAEEKRIRQIIEAMKAKKAMGKLTPDRMAILQKAAVDYEAIRKTIAATEKELSACHEQTEMTEGACIKARKTVYSGVKLMIAGEFTITSTEYQFCKFIKDWHEIKRVSL